VGAWLLIDVRDGMERTYYYCRTHDFIHPALIESVLEPGGTYVDIGANIGIHTLRAARRVLPDGKVIAFEANPRTAARLRAHAAVNRLSNVTVFDVALSDNPGKAVLKTGAEPHAGTFTLEAHGQGKEEFEVPLARGDDLLANIPLPGRALVKIDVEGHELHVLRGMTAWLAAHRPTVIMEFTPAWLGASGQVSEFFHQHGYQGWKPQMRRAPWGSASFHFAPLASETEIGAQEDILWMPAGQQPPAGITYNPARSPSSTRRYSY